MNAVGTSACARLGTTWSIDPVELARVFPLLAIPGAPPLQPRIEHGATTDVLVAELRATIADVRRDRDHWREAHERGQVALAEALQRQLPPPVEQDAPPKRRWWKWASVI